MVRSISQIAYLLITVLFYSPLVCFGQGPRGSDILRYFSSESSLVRYAHFRGQPQPTKELRALLNRQAKWDEAGLNDPSGSGSRLRFERVGDPAAGQGEGVVRYRVFAEGAPPDRVFVLHIWQGSGPPSTDPRDLYVNTQGLVMTHRPKPEQENSLKAPGEELEVESAIESGEPLRLSLARRDGESSIYGTLIAHPILADDQGCKLEARIAAPKASALLIVADGFPAKAKIPLVLESSGAVANEALETDADGHAVMAVIPYALGRSEGTLKASAEGPNCLPSVTLPWGGAAKTEARPERPAH